MCPSLVQDEILAVGPVLKMPRIPLRRKVLRKNSDGIYKISTDIVEETPLSSNSSDFTTLTSIDTTFSNTSLEDACWIFASQVEVETSEANSILSRFTMPPAQCSEAELELVRFLGWIESVPSQSTLREKLSLVAQKQIISTWTRFRLLSDKYAISTDYSLHFALLGGLLTLSMLSSYPLIPFWIIPVATVLAILLFQPQIQATVEAILNRLLGGMKGRFLSETAARTCRTCGCFDLKYFGVQTCNSRICPKCHPLAAIAAELNRPMNDGDSDTLSRIASHYTSTDSPSRQINDLKAKFILAASDGLIAHGPWQQEGSEKHRLTVRYAENAYFITLETEHSTDAELGIQQCYRTTNLMDIMFRFTILLKFFNRPYHHELPVEGPYNGSTQHWSLRSNSIQNIVESTQDFRTYLNSCLFRLHLALAIPFGATLYFYGKHENIINLVSQSSIAFLLILPFLVSLLYSLVTNNLSYRIKKRAIKMELKSRRCVICGLVDVSPNLLNGGYGRPCPLCFFEAARSASIDSNQT